MQDEPEKDLQDRLALISTRIQEIADMEARAALVGGYGARGEMMPEKLRLIDRTDEILNELKELYSREVSEGQK